MVKQDVMDIWSALQWAVRDQKADQVFNASHFCKAGAFKGSITGKGIEMAQLGVMVDVSRGSGADLDPDAERIWQGVELLFAQWRKGELAAEVGANVPVQMQRCLARLPGHPVVEMVMAARSGDMPDWMPGGWTNDASLTRRQVEESRLVYLLVWDLLAALCTRLQASDSMGITIEMPSIPRSPWNARKKVQKAC